MSTDKRPIAVTATEVPPRLKKTAYPPDLAKRVEGREKRPLGDAFGLTTFGVNLTSLAPGAQSALRHVHTVQDEFVYILKGRPTLITDEGRTPLVPGMCAGFKAANGNAHHLVNETSEEVIYLEMGDRLPGDGASYPDDDLVAAFVDGAYRFTRKDGTPIPRG